MPGEHVGVGAQVGRMACRNGLTRDEVLARKESVMGFQKHLSGVDQLWVSRVVQEVGNLRHRLHDEVSNRVRYHE